MSSANKMNILTSKRPQHGGRLAWAVEQYGIEKENWLDISTGINPKCWPVPDIPESVWRCLPDHDDLLAIARCYYAQENLLVTAGSQQSIDLLPKLLGEKLKVGIVTPAYAEHAYAWKKNGHQVELISVPFIQPSLENLDVLVVVNPNNPSGYCFERQQLLNIQRYFQQRSKLANGYLVVDEAFMDCTPENSIISHVSHGNLIVLRSIGKFFGLAGIRCGFIAGPENILGCLQQEMSPWSVNHPARWIVSRALADDIWIAENKKYLQVQSESLRNCLQQFFANDAHISGCCLFQSVYCREAPRIFQLLAQQGVLVRLLDDHSGLRFGLPGDLNAMNKLTNAMKVDFNCDNFDR